MPRCEPEASDKNVGGRANTPNEESRVEVGAVAEKKAVPDEDAELAAVVPDLLPPPAVDELALLFAGFPRAPVEFEWKDEAVMLGPAPELVVERLICLDLGLLAYLHSPVR